MCRFLIYKGREMLMADLLTKPEQSLIKQSYHARERKEPLNGDGFGVGWYVPEIDPEPCIFTSISPAWSNRNLSRLADKTRSTCVFAHVRAASPGIFVNELNCHPFQFDKFMWMHNGRIAQFNKIKRQLLRTLRDEVYDGIEGTTDSEHAFAVFLDKLYPHLEDYSADTLKKAMIATLKTLSKMTQKAGISGPSHYNFALTDGQTVIATRYTNDPSVEPPTLYISSGDRLESVDGEYRMRPAKGHDKAVIIASEPLTEDRNDWRPVPRNHLVIVSPELHIQQLSLD
ncbi:MAG: class II glutamine amidotransferase [Rhodospirillales bacterium]|nr:class II glutamine amidotransferase [Rhodospirillales bacterium]